MNTMRGVALALDWLCEVVPESDLAGMVPEDIRDHDLYVRLMQVSHDCQSRSSSRP